ncbi:MAG: hypothetical protein M1820_004625 [Bogoriella megaspora]|nr:MAG: hypothetical protein M1820_004625 [Bogoriella megaspora]
MSLYQYTPLQKPDQQIRLLTLLPGSFDEEVHAVLQVRDFIASDAESVEFEALSYVWGSSEESKGLQVHDEAHGPEGARLFVTQNLVECLRYLRDEAKERVLWIDAISINQQDNIERGQQVARIAGIYKKAKHLVIWLGVESDSSARALNTLVQLDSRITVNWKARRMSHPEGKEAHLDELDDIVSKRLSDIEALLKRPFFTRLWVLQETERTSDATVQCGRAVIPWRAFRNGVFCVWNYSYRHPVNGELMDLILAGYDLVQTNQRPFEEVMFAARNRKCLDPRDRVYAMLGMLSDQEKHVRIKPDYSKEPNEVYQDTVEAFLNDQGRLDLLRTCEPDDTGDGGSSPPSWVPDWSKPRSTHHLPVKRAAQHLLAQARIIDGRILCVKGLCIGTIKDVKKVRFEENATYESVVDDIRYLAPPDLRSDYVSGGTVFDAYCRTLIADCFRARWNPEDEQEVTEQKGREILDTLISSKGNSFLTGEETTQMPESTPRYYMQVRRFCYARSVFRTSHGHIGLAPSAAQPGDQVCSLLGCRSPLLLRPLDGNGHQYRLLGECYIDGEMANEAILGRLPDYCRTIVSFEGGGFKPAFRDHRDEHVHSEDPRFTLVLGEDYSERFPATNEESVAQTRNRLALEIMKKRGVMLDEFIIV